jgi:hypothetical protein
MKKSLIKVLIEPVDPNDPKAVAFAKRVLDGLKNQYGQFEPDAPLKLAMDDKPGTVLYSGVLLTQEMKPTTTPKPALEHRPCGWDKMIADRTAR